ncbi:DUF488 domain-containing protein [Enteractinococcus fodinae]|uniref:Uncharacterized protein (DUF488 family) n=1 Tax=Enteractinococcus fodinae TaxID=684663 RepID=A0ABU2B2J7_9MICC|nr:DUF488 domain-containing protein [Enteractinococcus fodinae]MDR7347835.1 uncharacterized protein (DUF488 family) [Enteractinococcus fodinae]
MTRPTVYTVGHSNRSLDEFLELMVENSVRHVVDVRKLPGSKRYPQFNADTLAEQLADHDIELTRAAGLTGRRKVSKDIAFGVNAWWQNRSFHNYADHALSDEFRQAFTELEATARAQPTVVMCAEAVWWRCHRRIIADYLLMAEYPVEHIMGPGQLMTADLSAGAVSQDDGSIVYPKTDDTMEG